MRIATFTNTRGWPAACRAQGFECVELPRLPNARRFTSTIEERIHYGRLALDRLRREPVDLIVDTFGDGLLFVDDPRRAGKPVALHEVLGVPLVSYWTETLRVLFKGVDPVVLRRALESPTWFKAVFTHGHLREMEFLGIDNCFYLPAGAVDRQYNTQPLDPAQQTGVALFAGNQQSLYFAHGDGADTRTQWPGLIALACVDRYGNSIFLDAYRMFNFGPAIEPGDDHAAMAEKTARYYDTKLCYSATRNLTLRDRFVLFLKRTYGPDFRLYGHRWRDIYGLDAEPYVADPSAYLELHRTVPICANFCNGDNETGLNFRHFEITAAGGFLLAYDQPELEELFDVGRECDVFRDEGDLCRKIDYYLAHPQRRVEIALAGQQRTLRSHLVSHRLQEVVAWLRARDLVPTGPEPALTGAV